MKFLRYAFVQIRVRIAENDADGTFELLETGGHFRARPDSGQQGHVQAIKRPTLLEISGPLIMSYPISNNLQYRLRESEDGTLIKFHHMAFGLIREDDRHVKDGWKYTHVLVKVRAEAAVKRGKAAGR